MTDEELTVDEARARSALVEGIAYRIELDLTGARQDPTFRSVTVLTFSAIPGTATFLDLIASEVHEVVLNGEALDRAKVVAGNRIMLPLLVASNEVRVVADCWYTTTGEGMHRFADPVDRETYLYTQFEVPDARRVFACFDQPDLKARFQLTVSTPPGWTVISNVAPPRPGSGEVYRFGWTPPIPTYIACVIAGPYASVSDTYRGEGGRALPLGIYCRQSLRQYLDAAAIFDVTRQGLDYFEDRFGIEYPFDKYDQVFVPEFNNFGMENAAAVAIRDENLFRSKVTDRDHEERADTILHEMAHMWFGNLVTMTWWDDLWLNESFATFMSTLCRAEAAGSRWPEAWTTFSDSMKSNAYEQDQLPTTHPIVAEIDDVSQVLNNLDGITYEKGASVLRQLAAYVGQEAFFAGVHAYMKKHAWGNTRLRDLLAALEASSGRDLGRWSRSWLETAGVNVLRARIESADDGTVASVAIHQEAPALPDGAAGVAVLRPHRIAVGMYDAVDGALVRTERIELDVDGPVTAVPVPPSCRRPAVLLPNDDDLSYAKVRLDPASWATVRARVADFDESLPRALCWSIAWDMTRDGELATRDYLEMVLTGLGREPDIGIVQAQQRRLRTALHFYADPAWRPHGLARVSAESLERSRTAVPGGDHQLTWVEAFAATARSAEHVDVLCAILNGGHDIDGLVVDDDLRWTVLERLSTIGAVGEDAVDAELTRDDTAAGQRRHATCVAARGTARAKADAWTAVVEEGALANAIQSAVITGFAQPDQHELLAPYTEKYFAAIEHVFAHRSHEMRRQIIVGLYPSLQVEPATLEITDAWLARAEPPAALRRMVLEGRAGVERSLRARAADHAQ